MAPGSLLQPLRKTRWKPTQRAIAVLIAQESHGSSPCARQELFLQLLKSEGLILTNPQLGCWSPGASSPLGDREATGNLPRHRAQLPPQTPRHESKCKEQTSPAQPHEGLRTNPPGSPPRLLPALCFPAQLQGQEEPALTPAGLLLRCALPIGPLSPSTAAGRRMPRRYMVLPRGLRGGPVAESSRPPAPIPAAAGSQRSQPALLEPMAQAGRGVASRERPAAPVAPSQLGSPAGAEAGTAGAGGPGPQSPPSAVRVLPAAPATSTAPASVPAVTIPACP